MNPIRITLLLAVTGCVVNASAQAIPGRTLIWSDEFTQADGTKPDSAKWGNDIGGSGWGNNELQYYTNRTENARIENGHLVIEARAENFGGRNYTSARLLTKDKVSWTYGRIEARIKIPKGQGIWPAFWMLGANIGSAGWPLCGEIDIMENIGSLPSTLYGTIHGPGYSGGNGISGNTVLAGGCAWQTISMSMPSSGRKTASAGFSTGSSFSRSPRAISQTAAPGFSTSRSS